MLSIIEKVKSLFKCGSAETQEPWAQQQEPEPEREQGHESEEKPEEQVGSSEGTEPD